MAKLDLYSMLQASQPKLSPQDEADIAAYKAIQRQELQTPIETYKPTNLGDVYTGIKQGKGFLGKVGGGLSALLNYANTSEGKKIIAGMGSAGMAPGMLNEADIARQKEEGLRSASVSKEAQRKQNISELLKEKENIASEERKATNPEILKLLGVQAEREYNRPFKEAELEKTKAETVAIPSQRALEEKKAQQAAAEFNAKQIQDAQEKNLNARGWIPKILGIGKVRPQTVGQLGGKTASGVEWRVKG